MIDTEARLDALLRYASRKGRPLSLREHRYVRARIRYRRYQRAHAYFCLFVGFSAIILCWLAVSITPFAWVLAFGAAFLNLVAAEELDPKEPVRKARPKRREHPLLREHRLRLAELEGLAS